MFIAPAGEEGFFYRRWLGAQPGYNGAPQAPNIINDGKFHQLYPPGGTGVIVSSVACRNNTGNSGVLQIRSGSSGGPVICTLQPGQDRSIFWADPGSLWYIVTGGASTDVFEVSWGA